MKMMAHSVYEEQFADDISPAKKLLTESVNRVAEAVESIATPERVEERDFGKFQVVILNTWDDGQNQISIPENFVLNGKCEAEWNELEKNYYQVRDVPQEISNNNVTEHQEEDQDSAKNLSWLLNFKVESLFHPLDGKNESNNIGERNGNVISQEEKKRNQSTDQNGALPRASPMKNNSNYKKPPFTYTELIEQALRERGELTVSGIYKWISQNFPYYRPDDDRWKNSVRHNLSINPHFSKGGKASKGAGHLWTVVSGDERSRSSWKRRRLEQFVNEQRQRKLVERDEANDAARLISEESLMVDDDDALNCTQQGWVTTQIISLEQSAEDILFGVKREVEVEYLASIPPDEETERSCGSADSDFLNPVSKEKAVEESGLLSDEGLVPAPYSDINLSHPSNDVSFFSDEEMTLQYYELALAASSQ